MIYRGQGRLLILSLRFHIWEEWLFSWEIGSFCCSEVFISAIQFYVTSVKAVCIELLLYCKAMACKVEQQMFCIGFTPLGLATQWCSKTVVRYREPHGFLCVAIEIIM